MLRFSPTLVILLLCCVIIACSKNSTEVQEPPVTIADVAPSPESPTRVFSEDEIARRKDVETKMLRGEYLHDGAIALGHVGDHNSVPALLVVLEKHPPFNNGAMVCTTAHALAALKKITGADVGNTHEAWSSWWEEYKLDNSLPER